MHGVCACCQSRGMATTYMPTTSAAKANHSSRAATSQRSLLSTVAGTRVLCAVSAVGTGCFHHIAPAVYQASYPIVISPLSLANGTSVLLERDAFGVVSDPPGQMSRI